MDNGAARIELYACMTPNVLKVMLMLGELDLAFRINHVRIYRGENFAPGFEDLHPFRKLPVLIDHDGPQGKEHKVFESGAILLYLAEKTGRLLGSDAGERSIAIQWLMLQMSSVGPAFGNAGHFAQAAPETDSYARQRFVTQAARLCELYDRRLRENQFLAGESYTIADVATFPWLWRHPTMVGLDMAQFPDMQRWVSEVRERPALARVHDRYRQIVQTDRADLAAAGPDVLDRFLGRGSWSLA